MKHIVIVTIEKIITSTILLILDLINFFRITPNLEFIFMKNAPKRPPIIPRIIGLWIYFKSKFLSSAKSANFISLSASIFNDLKPLFFIYDNKDKV